MTTCAQCHAPLRADGPRCSICGAPAHTGAAETAPLDPRVGQNAGPYVLRAKLAEDSFGAIFRAEQPTIGRKVTVRILHPWFSRDASVVRQFESEVRTAKRLQNPHVVAIHDVGRMSDGSLFLAMEHLEGAVLADRLAADGRMEPARAVAIATQCLEGLAVVHRHGLRHGALEPSKIMLVSRGGPDFAKLVDVSISLLAPTHEDGRVGRRVPGTPQYMAPEQFSGEPVDPRSDLYALGLVVYEMLAGRPPFVERSLQAYRQRHLHDPPPPLSQVSPHAVVPPSIEACVMRALAKSPHHRPQTADAFADELWAALMATVERSDLPIPQVRRERRSPVALIASVGALAGAALGLGIGAYLFLRPAAEPPASGPRAEPVAATSEANLGALLARPTAELEGELRQIVVASESTRAADLTLTAWREAAAHPPDDIDPDTFRRLLLARFILAWRAPADATKAAAPLDELEAAFLTMPSVLSVDVRRGMLNGLKQTARLEPDPRSTIRTQLVRWIDAYGKNGDWPLEEEQIEIVEELGG